MYTTHKLTHMPFAQAKVFHFDDDTVALVSYRTTVITIDRDGWLTCTGTYSRTTIRHIGAFMKEYVTYPNGSKGSYYDAKAVYLGNYKFNFYTGEVRDLGE